MSVHGIGTAIKAIEATKATRRLRLPSILARQAGFRLFCRFGRCLRPLDSSRQNRRPEESNNLEASGGQEIDDLLNGVVGAVVGGFEFARWLVSGIWAVMEAAVGERS